MSAFDHSRGEIGSGSTSNSGPSSRRRESGENKQWLPRRYHSSPYYHRNYRYEYGHPQSMSSGHSSVGYEGHGSQSYGSRRPEQNRSSGSSGTAEHSTAAFERRQYSRESSLNGSRDGSRHNSSNSGGDLIGGASNINHSGDLISPRSGSANGGSSFGTRGAKRDYWSGNSSSYSRPAYSRSRYYDEPRYRWNPSRNSPSSSYYHSVSPRDSVSAHSHQDLKPESKPSEGTDKTQNEVEQEGNANDEDDEAYSPKIGVPGRSDDSSKAVENVNIEKMKQESTAREDHTEDTAAKDGSKEIKPESTESVPKPLESTSSGPIDKLVIDKEQKEEKLENSSDIEWSEDEFPKSNGCIFPLQEVPYKLWGLKCTGKKARRAKMIYFTSGHIDSLDQYNFYGEVLGSFKKCEGVQLFGILSKLHEILKEKQSRLTEEYISRDHIWRDRCSIMDEHCRLIDDLEDRIKKDKENKKDEKKKKKEEQQRKAREQALKEEEERKQKARRARHHGDSVRTEAEFLDILATFEKEREKDPLVKAQYGAAIIPEQTMDPVQKMGLDKYMNSNNRVQDKDEWARRIVTDPIDTFTDAEQKKFEKAFGLYPKKFGRISKYMGGLRSPEECVLHYYVTKRKVDYKEIVASKNKRGKRKAKKKERGRRHSKEYRGKSDLKTPNTPDSSLAESSFETPVSISDKKESTGAMLRSHNFRRYSGPAKSPESPQTPSTPQETRLTPSTPQESRSVSESRRSASIARKSRDEDADMDVDDAETEPDSEAETEPDSDALYAGNRFSGDDTHAYHNIAEAVRPDSEKRDADSSALQHSSDAADSSEQTSNATLGTIASLAASTAVKVEQTELPDGRKSKRGRKRTREVSVDTSRDKRKERGHRLKNKVTSYWSVQESAEFPALLGQYGTNWDSIAKSLGSKTAPMVRNFYQRGLGVNPDWRKLAADADGRNASDSWSGQAVQTSMQPASVQQAQIHQVSSTQPYNEDETYISRRPSSSGHSVQALPTLQQPSKATNTPYSEHYPSGISRTPQQAQYAASSVASLPPLTRKPTIMSLLNNDSGTSPQEPPRFGSAPSAIASGVTLPPIRPSISNMINSAYDYRPALTTDAHYDLQPGSTFSNQLKREPPTFGDVQGSAALQQGQQPPSQDENGSSTHTEKRGMSALEGLAQVAFERK